MSPYSQIASVVSVTKGYIPDIIPAGKVIEAGWSLRDTGNHRSLRTNVLKLLKLDTLTRFEMYDREEMFYKPFRSAKNPRINPIQVVLFRKLSWPAVRASKLQLFNVETTVGV